MAVTSRQIIDFLLANPGMSDADIVAAMETYGISPSQMATAVGLPEGQIAARVGATVAPGQSVTLGDTIVQPVHETVGSGQDQQIGGIQNVITYKVGENQAGGGYNQYSASGALERTGTQQTVDTSLGGAVKQLVQNPGFQIAAAAYGANSLFGGGEGLFGGGTGAGSAFEAANAGAGAGADYLGGSLANVGTAGTIGNTGMTLSELTQLDMALGGTGGTAGALTLAEQLGGLAAGTLTGAAGLTSGGTGTAGLMSTGAGLTTAGAGGLGGATGASGLGGSLGSGLTTAGAGGLGGAAGVAGLGGSLGSGLTTAGGLVAGNTLLGGSTLGSTLGGLTTGVVGSTLGSTIGSTLGSTLGTAAATGLGGLTAAQLGALLSSGLTLGGGLLQSQTSKAAALAAQQKIDTETASAKQAAMFRPVGMTTRFGTSQFQVDPVTGQLTSAGYTLSPEAKNAQDRLVKLAESGLQQAEGAQAQYAPLQTGAQSLFGLGNQYLAQNPQDVAQNYLNQQMALLQPGRQIELANLQNKLQQQGRGGLSVAQGGTMGATTPELQALYNARAQQEAQLAANAQQYGQQNVLFGAGLLGQGATAMGNYYGGQQAAYSPYTTAMGQVTGLETAAQQPLMLGAQLGQTAATAGANVGKLGLVGAGQSVDLATGQAATNNPYANVLAGLGGSPTFGTAAGNYLSGLFS